MCLGVPGRIVRWIQREAPFATAEIAFEGVNRICNLSCVPEAEVGDYVIVHAGIAICRVDEHEAQRVFDSLAQMGSPPNDAGPAERGGGA